MKKIPLEIIIPVYNEGEKVVKLLELFQISIKTQFRVLFCYDLENDNIFKYIDKFKEYNFDIQLIKNLHHKCRSLKTDVLRSHRYDPQSR